MSIEAGKILSETREQKGISIKEASDSLHIRIPYLQALESGRAEIIPSAVQARGFLRIYSEYLDLNANDMIQEWDNPGSTPLSQKQQQPPEQTQPAPPPVVPPMPAAQPEQPVPPAFQASERSSYTQFQQDQPSQIPVNIPQGPAPSPEPPVFTDIPKAPQPQMSETPEKPGKSEKKNKEKKNGGGLFRKKSPAPEKKEDPEQKAKELFKDIGEQLAYRRKFLSLSLEDCESQTLIRSIYIESMENGSFEQLPSFIQARGMLNNYASFLDLDVDTLMLKLATAIQLLSQKKNNRTEDNRKKRTTKKAGKMRKFFTPDLFVGVFVIVGIAGIIIYSAITITAYRRNISTPTMDLGVSLIDQFMESTRTPEFLPTASPTVVSGLQAQNFDIIPNEQATESAEVISNQPVQIFVNANQRALMTVLSDGKEVFNGRTLPDNTYPFDAENEIELRTSNGDALSVTYNQQNLGRLGRLGENVTIIFSPYLAATPTPQFSPTPTNTLQPTYTSMPETPLPTNTPTPYIP